MTRCEIPGCRGEVELTYLDHGICDSHWNELNADDASAEQLKMVLSIGTATEAATEVDMAARKKSTRKVTTKAKATPPKEKAPGTRTFAVRITDQELAALHTAAGPRNAARFARAVLAAFAGGDAKAFAQVLDEATKARG